MSISLENVTHLYSEGTPLQVSALDDVSLEILPGEFLGIIGQTGSGKSTLVQHINGLLKPNRGKVYLEGQDITLKGVNLRLIRQRVGMIFQYPEQQLFEETVFDDVAFGPRNMGLEEEEVALRVEDSLNLVGLEFSSLKDRSPFQISGGQRRRVAIAGVLAMKPDYLILDEPTANLDPRGRDEILTLLANLNRQEKVTIILVSHSMEEIARVVDRLVVIHQGKIITTGPLARVFTQEEELERIGLSLPQITSLMHGLKKASKQVTTEIFTPEQAVKEIISVIRGKNYV